VSDEATQYVMTREGVAIDRTRELCERAEAERVAAEEAERLAAEEAAYTSEAARMLRDAEAAERWKKRHPIRSRWNALKRRVARS
jgi:hypothetical protein